MTQSGRQRLAKSVHSPGTNYRPPLRPREDAMQRDAFDLISRSVNFEIGAGQ
jgi:hypothetical protein